MSSSHGGSQLLQGSDRCAGMHPDRSGDGNGKAWFFFPCAPNGTKGTDGTCDAAEHCDCSRVNNMPGSMVCKGPTIDDALIAKYIQGKKWIVFIHGGEFAWNNNIGAGYAILSAEVAMHSGMGVLAIDYRASPNGQNPYRASSDSLPAQDVCGLSCDLVLFQLMSLVSHHNLACLV